MLTKEALRGAIIGTGLFSETEGCMEVNETSSNSYAIEDTVVFLNNEYQHACVYANAKEGYIKRLKRKKGTVLSKSLQVDDLKRTPNTQKPIEETVKGDVLILLCSDKVMKLLRGDYERE